MNDAKEFVFERTLNAPLDLVWKVHTEPDFLMSWWGPAGFKATYVKMDLRPGGMLHYGLTDQEGNVMWGKMIYREVIPKIKLVFVLSFSNEKGDSVKHPMAPDWPLEILNTVIFEETGNVTKVIIKGQPINSTPDEANVYYNSFDSLQGGFGGSYSKLEEYIRTL